MLSATPFIFFLLLLLVALLCEPWAKKIHLPFSIVLVAIGFLGSEITTNLLALDTGIRWDNFKFIIFYIILPILIFQAAIEINIKLLWHNIVPIILMTLPLMMVSVFVIAWVLYFGIDHPIGFPWIAALIAGALLSATDPASVISLLKQENTPEKLQILLEGESLFNYATAIMFFHLFIAIATQNQQSTDFLMLSLRFIEVFCGGIIIGIFIGLISSFIINLLDEAQGFVLISIITAYTVFFVAEDIFHFSGVIAVLICGITVAWRCKSQLYHDSYVRQSWQLFGKVAEALIFLLAGVTITLMMFLDQWLAILIGIAAVIVARVATIYGFFPLISVLPGVETVSLRHQTILVWGGVRGTVTLALALSLPLTLDYWYTIQSIAYGVVLFTLFFQTISMPLILRKLIRP